MIYFSIVILIAFISFVLSYLFGYFFRVGKSSKPLRMQVLSNVISDTAKIEYFDREKLFRNHKYKLQGRPDEIIFDKGRYYLVEYKSRTYGIYQSDIKQAIATLLACRANNKYKNMSDIIIYNSGGQIRHLTLNLTDEDLFNRISKEYNQAYDIKNPKLKSQKVYKNFRNCNNCGYISYCKM